MAKKREEGEESSVEQVTPKEGAINLHKRVKVEVLDSPHGHKSGDIVECSPHVAAKMVKNGWGKLVAIALLFLALGAQAQTTAYQKLAKVVSALPTTATKLIISDTVTNTGTNFLTSGYPQLASYTAAVFAGNPTALVNLAYSTTVQVNITKISGTVAGTVTLQGSIDGVNYSTATSGQLAITATYTATDVASQSKNWIIVNSPYRFYRVSWTGAGTMAASMTAFVWSH